MNVCGLLAWQALGVQPSGVEIVNACGSQAWQALGVQSGRAEIMHACVDLRGMAWWRS
jgi:hypothetical protein